MPVRALNTEFRLTTALPCSIAFFRRRSLHSRNALVAFSYEVVSVIDCDTYVDTHRRLQSESEKWQVCASMR